MKKFTVLLVVFLALFVIQTTDAALVKSVAAVDEWAETAQNAVREGATTDISGCYSSVLHIDIALTSATIHTGTKIQIQVSSTTPGAPTDEDWTTLTEFVGPLASVAPNPESLGGAEAAGQIILEVASTVGLYDDDGIRWIFIEDNVVANSEMALLVAHVGNTSVTVQDGTTNAHDASDTLYDVARNYTIRIPVDYNRVRVIYDNTYDSNGATVHTKCRISKVTEY